MDSIPENLIQSSVRHVCRNCLHSNNHITLECSLPIARFLSSQNSVDVKILQHGASVRPEAILPVQATCRGIRYFSRPLCPLITENERQDASLRNIAER